MRRRFSRPSPALCIALIALFVALGGTSFAAPAREAAHHLISGKSIKHNSIGSADIQNNSLTTSDVRNHSLLAKDFKAGQLPRGATGAKGDKGDQGIPGSAIAYATVSDDNRVDPARSSGVTTANVSQGDPTTVCFNGLPFTPHLAVANVSAGAGVDGGESLRTSTQGTTDCPGNEQVAVTGVAGDGTNGSAFDPPAFVIALY